MNEEEDDSWILNLLESRKNTPNSPKLEKADHLYRMRQYIASRDSQYKNHRRKETRLIFQEFDTKRTDALSSQYNKTEMR